MLKLTDFVLSPYLYRGIANYNLGDHVAAEVDLKKSNGFGQVGKSKRDKAAKKKLETYLNLLAASQKSEPEINMVKTTFNEAVDFFNQKNFEAAEKKFEAVLKQDPNYSRAQIYLKKIEGELAKVADLKTKQNESPEKNLIERGRLSKLPGWNLLSRSYREGLRKEPKQRF